MKVVIVKTGTSSLALRVWDYFYLYRHLFAKNTYNTTCKKNKIAYGRCDKAEVQH